VLHRCTRSLPPHSTRPSRGGCSSWQISHRQDCCRGHTQRCNSRPHVR
jgi:hypothetical protein